MPGFKFAWYVSKVKPGKDLYQNTRNVEIEPKASMTCI